MNIDTTFLRRCIATLELALQHLKQAEEDAIIYDLHRAACVKEFELVLEQSGKLLRKRLTPYFASNRQADRLVFKDLFRHTAKHGLPIQTRSSAGSATETTGARPRTTTAPASPMPP